MSELLTEAINQKTDKNKRISFANPPIGNVNITSLFDYLPPLSLLLSLEQQLTFSTALLSECGNICQQTHPCQLAEHSAGILHDILTPEQRGIIDQFRQLGHFPYLQVKQLVAAENLPLTPMDDHVPEAPGWHAPAAALLAVMHLCDLAPASFLDEMGGRLYHMVMPARHNAKSYARSTKALNLHTEVVNGYFCEEQPGKGAPISPEGFGLVCLRNPDTVPTTVLPVVKLIKQLDDRTVNTLMRPVFQARSQSSFDRNIRIEQVPVFNMTKKGLLGMRFSHSKLSGMTQTAQNALECLKQLIAATPVTTLALQPGDALIINNRLCLHGRAHVANAAREDGLNRWLIRVYGYEQSTLEKLPFHPEKKQVMIVSERFFDEYK